MSAGWRCSNCGGIFDEKREDVCPKPSGVPYVTAGYGGHHFEAPPPPPPKLCYHGRTDCHDCALAEARDEGYAAGRRFSDLSRLREVLHSLAGFKSPTPAQRVPVPLIPLAELVKFRGAGGDHAAALVSASVHMDDVPDWPDTVPYGPLGVGDDAVVKIAQLTAERLETVAALRRLCAVHGDNDWKDDLHLADVVEKHLGRHLG